MKQFQLRTEIQTEQVYGNSKAIKVFIDPAQKSSYQTIKQTNKMLCFSWSAKSNVIIIFIKWVVNYCYIIGSSYISNWIQRKSVFQLKHPRRTWASKSFIVFYIVVYEIVFCFPYFVNFLDGSDILNFVFWNINRC